MKNNISQLETFTESSIWMMAERFALIDSSHGRETPRKVEHSQVFLCGVFWFVEAKNGVMQR